MLFSVLLLNLVSDPQETVVPPEFDTYWVVFLKRGPERSQNEEEQQKLQMAHLTHLTKLVKSGKAHVAGPLEAGPEQEILGFIFFPGDLEESDVRASAEADPAVKAGRLIVDVVKWWTPKGVVTFHPLPY